MTGNQILTFAARTMRALRVGLSMSVVASFVVSAAFGQVIATSQGFEAPNYSTTFPPVGADAGTGILEGQPNPALVAFPLDVWAKSSDPNPGGSKAIVQSAVKLTGNQAVKLTRGANSNVSWGIPLTGPQASQPGPWPTQRFVFIDWDMRVEQTPLVNPLVTQFGPFFGARAINATVNTNPPDLLAGFGVDATTGDVLYELNGGGGTHQLQDTGGLTVAFGAWNHFQMKLDYLLGTYTFSLNGTSVTPFSPTGFVTPGSTRLTDVPIMGVVAGNNPNDANLTGTAYYDNFVVRQAPEPGTLVLAVMSLVGLLVGVRKGRRL